MPPIFFVLLLKPGSARVVALKGDRVEEVGGAELEEKADVESARKSVIETLRACGLQRGSLAVLFADPLCLPITADIERRLAGRPSAVAFDLEECFPVDIEQMIVGIARGKGRRLAIGLDLRRHGELLHGLMQAGIRIGLVNSVGLLEFQREIESKANRTKLANGIRIWTRTGPEISHTLLTAWGQPVAWASGQAGTDGREHTMQLMELVADGGPLASTEDLGGGSAPEGVSQPARATLEFAKQCTKGSFRPWIEFPLVRFADEAQARWTSPAAKTCTALLFGMVLAGIGFWIRSMHYSRLSHEAETIKAQLFGNEFPGRRIPLDIERALSSLRHSRAAEHSAQEAVADSSLLLAALRDVISALPDSGDVRFRITSITVAPDDVRLSGDVLDVGQLQRLGAALQDAGFSTDFEQLRAQDFSLVVRRKTAEPPP